MQASQQCKVLNVLKLQTCCKVPSALEEAVGVGDLYSHKARDATDLGFSAWKNLFKEFISHKRPTLETGASSFVVEAHFVSSDEIGPYNCTCTDRTQ